MTNGPRHPLPGAETKKGNQMTTTALKLIALALMLIDHIGEFIPGTPLFLRILGRASAPVFLFCSVWGFHYTHSRKAYLLRMYLCSALMGILDGILNASVAQPYEPCYNNIFSSLLMICLFIWLWEKGDRPWKKALLTLAYLAVNAGAVLLVGLVMRSSAVTWFLSQAPGWDVTDCYLAVCGLLPNVLTCEGGFFLIIMGIVLHFCKGSRKKLCWGYGLYCGAYLGILVCMGLSNPSDLSAGNWLEFLFRDAIQWLQILSLPLMLLYNGQRGRNLKYLFYIFYPLHITVLFCLGNFLAAR